MKPHEFYAKYANLPLGKRGVPINVNKYGLMSMDSVYTIIKTVEDNIRPQVMKRDRFLEIAEEFFSSQVV